MKKFYDTCALLNLKEEAFQEPFVISVHTLMELENIKTSRNKDSDVKYSARKVTKLLDTHPELYEVCYFGAAPTDVRLSGHIDGNTDADICYAAQQYNSQVSPIDFVTDDVSCRCIARDIYGLNSSSSEDSDETYTGYIKLSGSTEEINAWFESVDYSTISPNEYLTISNTETGENSEMRFNGESFVRLQLAPNGYLKGKNPLQRCAIDLMMNRDIDIAVIMGTYGSGKSYLATQMALYHVLEKGHQSKILGIREPAGEGAPVGYLKGTLEDKTYNFFLPIEQQLKGGEFELEALRQRGVLDTNIPYYMKGTTYNDTIMLVDEAEDLTEAQLRLIGTRLGRNSRIFLSGDYGQSLVDKTTNNPLAKMCNLLRGNPSFGCIYLDEDVRSSASKIFANLFK